MKGDTGLISRLNKLLASELSAISQYIVHSELRDLWHYEKIGGPAKKAAIDEMHHAEKLIERIVFLEGKPIVDNLDPIKIGEDVPKQFDNDWAAERKAITDYNTAIEYARKVGDETTADILHDNLEAEEGHIRYIEGQLFQIKQLGLSNYLASQI